MTGGRRGIQAVAMGASWGGLDAFSRLLGVLPALLPVPVLLVQHQRHDAGDKLSRLLATRTELDVVSPEDRDLLEPGRVYVAPAGYHMLVDTSRRICFSMGPPVHYSRPAIDELFFSAGYVYGAGLLGVILTGANNDGAAGLRYIRMRGGITMAQEPATAEAPAMPSSAIEAGAVMEVGDPDQLGRYIMEEVFG